MRKICLCEWMLEVRGGRGRWSESSVYRCGRSEGFIDCNAQHFFCSDL